MTCYKGCWLDTYWGCCGWWFVSQCLAPTTDKFKDVFPVLMWPAVMNSQVRVHLCSAVNCEFTQSTNGNTGALFGNKDVIVCPLHLVFFQGWAWAIFTKQKAKLTVPLRTIKKYFLWKQFTVTTVTYAVSWKSCCCRIILKWYKQ